LGAGSIAGDEYLHDMSHARELADGRVKWVETCFCATPLQEEQPYWEEFFDFDSIKDAHARAKCRDENGTEPWACCDCDCTKRLEAWLGKQGSLSNRNLSRLTPAALHHWFPSPCAGADARGCGRPPRSVNVSNRRDVMLISAA
jgi:hypothetical protein